MRAWLSKRDLITSIQDIIIIKTGLILNDNELLRIISKQGNENWSRTLNKATDDELLTIRGDEYEELITDIRFGIGDISDTKFVSVIDVVKKHPMYSEYIGEIIKRITDELIQKSKDINTIFADLIKNAENKDKIDVIMDIANFFTKKLNRSATSDFTVKKWDGVIPLSNLFNCELLPSDGSNYIDQRFIDYLYSQPEDLENINWRQFEGLAAQYFKSKGYSIILGKGRKDGGIDITAVRNRDNKSAPFVIFIQCKKYSSKNKVEVETVKSLYYDVTKKNGDLGLIATTSHLTKGSKDICAAEYNLTYAEKEKVIKWVEELYSKTQY